MGVVGQVYHEYISIFGLYMAEVVYRAAGCFCSAAHTALWSLSSQSTFRACSVLPSRWLLSRSGPWVTQTPSARCRATASRQVPVTVPLVTGSPSHVFKGSSLAPTRGALNHDFVQWVSDCDALLGGKSLRPAGYIKELAVGTSGSRRLDDKIPNGPMIYVLFFKIAGKIYHCYIGRSMGAQARASQHSLGLKKASSAMHCRGTDRSRCSRCLLIETDDCLAIHSQVDETRYQMMLALIDG